MVPEGWKFLDYWQSKEWLDVQDSLDILEERGELYCPERDSILRALYLVPFDSVRVVMVLQDPYANPAFATGVAASIPGFFNCFTAFPPTLKTILREWRRDLDLPIPLSGNLEPWCKQGVLLWNATPTIGVKFVNGKYLPISHKGWEEWPPLTQEIIERLSAKGKIVFVFFGQRAQEYVRYVDAGDEYNSVFTLAHPSPLSCGAPHQLTGSRLFSEIKRLQCTIHYTDPVDWRLE